MAEIYGFQATDANNNSAPPDGAPEFMDYAAVNDTMRTMMGKIARFLQAGLGGTKLTAGSATAYTLTTGQSLGAYAAGQVFSFAAHATSTGTVTLNVDGLGASAIVDSVGNPLVAGDIQLNGQYLVQRTASNFRVLGHFAQTSLVATVNAGRRTQLAANTTYFVRTDGSDANNGLANTAGGAFLTVQKALDVVYKTLDLFGFNVTIQLADGTYGLGSVSTPQVGSGTITLQGNNVTPANVILTGNTGSSTVGVVNVANKAVLNVKDMTLTPTTTGSGLVATDGAAVTFQNIRFAAAPNAHIVGRNGGMITATGAYAITGGAQQHWLADHLGIVLVSGITITLSGTPAFSTAFASAFWSSYLGVRSNTYAGTGATGSRFLVADNGTIDTLGTLTEFPGSTAGTVTPGGFHAARDPGTGFGGAVSVASAGTVDLGLLTSQTISITGTTTITSLGSAATTALPLYLLSFTGALTITHNATSLICPNGENIPIAAGDSVLALYLGSGNWRILAWLTTRACPAVGTANGLTITNNATTPNTQIDVTTTGRSILETAAGGAASIPALSVTINAATTGVNALDTGTLAASTWYYVWLISTGSSHGALLSLSSTAPTLPAGYIYRYRIGAVRTGGSSTFLRTIQKGNKTVYQVIAASTTPNQPLMISGPSGSVTIPTWTSQSVSNFVPPTAPRIQGLINEPGNYSSNFSIAAPNNAYGAYNSTTNAPPCVNDSIGSTTAVFDFTLESANIFYASNSSQGTMRCSGWVDAVNAN